MGYMYALNVGLFGSNLHNVLGLVLIIAVCLIVMWMTLYKKQYYSILEKMQNDFLIMSK